MLVIAGQVMSYRVDSFRVIATVYVPFEGYREINFALANPIDMDDPLVVMAMERHRKILVAAAQAQAPAGNLGGIG